MSLKAHHGTPHDFEKFNTFRVGSGESTQWFGWGLYFTDVESIANYYAGSVKDQVNDRRKDQLIVYFRGQEIGAGVRVTFFRNGETFGEKLLPNVRYSRVITEFLQLHYLFLLGTFLEAKQKAKSENKQPRLDWSYVYSRLDNNSVEKYIEGVRREDNQSGFPTNRMNDETISIINELVRKLKTLKESDFEYKPLDPIEKSYRYDVTIHKGKTPEQYDYLSWYDNLIPSQKEKIIKQIKTEKLKKKNFYVLKPSRETEVQPVYFHNLQDAKDYQKRWNFKNIIPQFGFGINQLELEKGGFTMDDLDKTVQEFYHQLSGLLGGAREASLFLLRAGIDGIKYPSNTISGGESRGLNYVVFDPNAITIEDKKELDS